MACQTRRLPRQSGNLSRVTLYHDDAKPGVVRRARHRTRAFVGLFASLALAALTSGAALADPQNPPLTPNDPSRALPPPPPDTSPPLSVHAGPAAGGAEDNAPRLVLRSVSFQGASALTAQALAPAWQAYAGKTVSLADLRKIGQNAEAIYTRAGFPFVAVLLKVQKVSDGGGAFDVVEGRISDLTVLGSDRTARRQATAALGGLVDKAPLSLDDVEAAYQNAKAIPGLTISGSLRRGTQPGGMDLVVATDRKPWRAYANLNNLYADAVGPWGLLAGLDVFGRTKFGDQLSVQAYTSLPAGRQVLVRGSYQLRLNEAGTTVSVSGIWGKANPQGALSVLALAQDVSAIRLDVTQPLVARANSKLQAGFAIEGSDQRTNVLSVYNLSNDHLRDLSLTLTGEIKGRWGRLAANAELHKDLDILSASHPGDVDLSRAGADPQALILRGGAELETRTLHRLRLDARVETQYAEHALTIPDQYAAGNLTIGRGYAPGAALGDRAVASSVELRAGPFDTFRKIQVEPFLFTDTVALWNVGPAPFQQRTLWSWGGGVRLQGSSAAHLDLLCAIPQTPPLGLGERKPGPMVLMNLTVNLSDAFSAIHRRLITRGS